jgi:hypothetical protein
MTWLTGVLYAMALWIGWPSVARSHGSITTTVLFDREIVRILSSHCVMCHGDQSLSFPLSTYQQTWVRGRDIRTQILRRHMPPWSAVSGYGEFVNDNNLTVRETQFMVSVGRSLGPRNAGTVFLNVARPDAAPAEVRATAHVGHWQLGEPALSRQLSPTRVEPGRGDFTQRSVIDPGITSDRMLSGSSICPAIDESCERRPSPSKARVSGLAAGRRGTASSSLPDGVAARLPARSRIVADVHYRSTDRPVVDQGTLGLFFSQGRLRPVVGPHSRRKSLRSRHASRVRPVVARHASWALRPDVAADIASIEVSARTADGGTEILLLVKNPAIAWPTPYILKRRACCDAAPEISFVVHKHADVRQANGCA